MIFFAGLCVVFSLALAVKGDTTTSTNATSEKAQMDTLILTMQNVTAGIDEFSVNIEESFENILATMFYTISNDTNSMYKYITSAVESAETVAEAISGSDAEVLECIESGKNEALLALEEAVQSALECFSTPVSSFETMLDELSAYGTEANTLATNASTAAEACFDGEVLSSAECLSALLIKYGFEYASLVTEVGLKQAEVTASVVEINVTLLGCSSISNFETAASITGNLATLFTCSITA